MSQTADDGEFFGNVYLVPDDDEVLQAKVDALPTKKRQRLIKWDNAVSAAEGRRIQIGVDIEKIRERRDDLKQHLYHLRRQILHGYARSDATDAEDARLEAEIARLIAEINRKQGLKDGGFNTPLPGVLKRIKIETRQINDAQIEAAIPPGLTLEEAFAENQLLAFKKVEERKSVERKSLLLTTLEAHAIDGVRRLIKTPNIAPLFQTKTKTHQPGPPTPGSIIWPTTYEPVATADIVGLVTWAAQELIEAKVLAAVRARFDESNSNSVEDRARRLAEIDGEILALDYQAGAIGAVIESQGGTVNYRVGAHPLTIIGLTTL